jgi:flagellar basal body-associated protein FliL
MDQQANSTIPSEEVVVQQPQKESTRFSLLIILGLISLIVLLGAGAWFVLQTKSSKQAASAIPSPTAMQTPIPTVPMETEYTNPFDSKEQYTNPFDTYQNPFEALEE